MDGHSDSHSYSPLLFGESPTKSQSSLSQFMVQGTPAWESSTDRVEQRILDMIRTENGDLGAIPLMDADGGRAQSAIDDSATEGATSPAEASAIAHGTPPPIAAAPGTPTLIAATAPSVAGTSVVSALHALAPSPVEASALADGAPSMVSAMEEVAETHDRPSPAKASALDDAAPSLIVASDTTSAGTSIAEVSGNDVPAPTSSVVWNSDVQLAVTENMLQAMDICKQLRQIRAPVYPMSDEELLQWPDVLKAKIMQFEVDLVRNMSTEYKWHHVGSVFLCKPEVGTLESICSGTIRCSCAMPFKLEWLEGIHWSGGSTERDAYREMSSWAPPQPEPSRTQRRLLRRRSSFSHNSASDHGHEKDHIELAEDAPIELAEDEPMDGDDEPIALDEDEPIAEIPDGPDVQGPMPHPEDPMADMDDQLQVRYVVSINVAIATLKLFLTSWCLRGPLFQPYMRLGVSRCPGYRYQGSEYNVITVIRVPNIM